MSLPDRNAVFLSYASQDAEAAKRIAEALRAAGVEVWFDQNELTGGDQWDQKIRKQIAECALFVPVISAETQARLEGYFRIEWKLAAQRTHAMAEEKAFLLPVVIDDTRDAEAKVPAEFKAVQWTRLPGGVAAEKFCARVLALLGGLELEPVRPRPGERGEGAASPTNANVKGGRRVRAAARLVAITVVLVLGGYFALRPAPNAGDEAALSIARPTPVAAAIPPSKAQQLVTQARSLYEPWDFASADDFKLAERLLKEATEIEPVNADAYAALAIVSFGHHVFGFDRSAARDALLRSAAERAAKLAPESDFAQLALALLYRRSPGTDDDAVRLLRALAARRGTDKFILRQLGSVLRATQRDEEALASFDRAAALPGGDAIALISRALLLGRQQRLDEMEAAVEEALTLRPDYGYAHIIKLVVTCYHRGDMGRTKLALQQIPARVMGDERVAAVAGFMWYWARDAERATEALRHVSHDYIESNVVTMPTGLLIGLVHRLAGRKEAAAIEWRGALGVLERRLKLNPTSASDLGDRAALLALLGERAGAEEALRGYEELRRLRTGRAAPGTWQIYADLGREAEVADFFAERLKAEYSEGTASLAAQFRFNPCLDPFRNQPRFQALAAEVDQFYAAVAKGSAKPAEKPEAKK